jgi:FkbM family methyltransferase
VVLVEADPWVASTLQSSTAGDPRVNVVNVAVAGRSGEAVLRVFNFAELSGLREPSALMRDLYPGLRMIQEVPVRAVTATDALSGREVDPSSSNCLVVDAPGQEMSIVENLSASGVLARFDVVRLHCGVNPLYEGATPVREIIDLLVGEGFEALESTEMCDPDAPWWHFRLGSEKLRDELAQVRDELSQVTGRLRLSESDLKDLQRRYSLSMDHAVRQRELAEAFVQRMKSFLANAEEPNDSEGEAH